MSEESGRAVPCLLPCLTFQWSGRPTAQAFALCESLLSVGRRSPAALDGSPSSLYQPTIPFTALWYNLPCDMARPIA